MTKKTLLHLTKQAAREGGDYITLCHLHRNGEKMSKDTLACIERLCDQVSSLKIQAGLLVDPIE